MASKTLTVSIVGDVSKLKKATGDAGRSVDTLGSKIKGAAIGLGVAALAKGAFDQAEEARKVAGQTAAVIKSTGGAANVSAKQVDELASSISKAAGVDDELVASAENMLMTFTGIKNVGVDKVFDRTTQAAVDMAAATGSDAVSAAKMLGKALNDPMAGLSKLTRAGVVFDDQQKAQIKRFQEAGQVAKAQGVILAEVEKEYGGSAAATATDADKARVAWENFLESAGTAAAPVFNNAASALSKVADGFNGLPQPVQQATLAIGAGAVAWAKWGDQIVKAGGYVQKFASSSVAPMAGVAAGLGVVYVAGEKLFNQWEDAHTLGKDIDSLGVALELLANRQKVGGELADQYGENLGKLKSAFDDVDVSMAERSKVWAGALWGRQQSAEIEAGRRSIDNLDKALAAKEPREAAAAYAIIREKLIALGIPAAQITAAFDDYGKASRDAGIAAETAAGKPLANLDKQLDKLGKLRTAILSAADARLSREEATQSLPSAEADRLNALGAYNNALGNYSRSGSLEDQQAVLRTRQALYDATQRVSDLQIKAAGATDDATKSLEIQTEQFKITADALRPGDPLRTNLAGLIADLDKYRDRVTLTNIAEKKLADDRAFRQAVATANGSGNVGLGGSGSGAMDWNTGYAPISGSPGTPNSGAPTMVGPVPTYPGRRGTGKGEGVTVNGNVVIQPQGESATQTMRDLSWHVRAGSGG